MEGDILAFVVSRVKSFQAWQLKFEGNNKVLTSNNELKTTKQSSAYYIKIFLANSLLICQRENTKLNLSNFRGHPHPNLDFKNGA